MDTAFGELREVGFVGASRQELVGVLRREPDGESPSGDYPNGITSFSPALPDNGGLRWVTNRKTAPTLKGLKPSLSRGDATLSGLEDFWIGHPRVARSSQPWADG
jgi:hypothetical protein